MGTSAKQTVDIGYATAPEIREHYHEWARATGVEDTPLGRIGPDLADAWDRDQLSSALVPDFPDVLTTVIATQSPQVAIFSRSLALAARAEGRVIGGLLARPQLRFVDMADRYGPSVQAQTLVRLMKLEIVTVAPEYHRRRIATTMVDYALEVMGEAHVQLVYGSYSAERPLRPFYRSLGFKVLGQGYGINIGPATGARLGIAAEQDERMFAKSLGAGPAVDASPPGEAPVFR